MDKSIEYTSPIGITSQFRFCGSCFRIDLFKGCSHGCEYCFINNRHENNPRMGNRNKIITFANNKKIENLFINSIDKNQTNTIEKELINRKTPLHLGGNSDPFQPIEFKENITKHFIELTKKYQYPVLISTKGVFNSQYLKNFDNQIHAFQISLFSDNQKSLNLFEKNTPSFNDRFQFIKLLKNNGFWVSVRIQPLIYLNEALSLINKIIDIVDFITIEHIKLQSDNKISVVHLKSLLPKLPFEHKGNSIVLNSHYKYDNIMRIKELVNNKVKLGFGDNDLHYYSDTLNCCGLDIINDNFKNWLNYNSMVIEKGITNGFIPINKINCFPYIEQTGNNYKEYVDNYLKKHKHYKNKKGFFN